MEFQTECPCHLPAWYCSSVPSSCVSRIVLATREPTCDRGSRCTGAERSSCPPSPVASSDHITAVCDSVIAFVFLHSGSHHSGSPSAHCSKSTGSLDSSKVYIVSHGGGQQVPGAVTKPYHRQGAANKYVIGWKKSEGSPPPEEPEVADCPR